MNEPTRMPTYQELAEKIRQVAKEKGEWAGLPVPFSDYPMTIEPRFPFQGLKEIGRKEVVSDGWKTVNAWHDHRIGATVAIQKNTEGRARLAYGVSGHGHKVAMLIGTLAVHDGWLPAAETKARTKLFAMVGHRKFNCYQMTGMLMERSKRSGVVYIFRQLRPTVALRPTMDGSDMRCLCTLCLHPIGLYNGAWAGVMTPTDDVIAHIAMMRGDEPKYWAHAVQHQPNDPHSGI